MFIPIPFEVQTVVKKESSLTGRSVRQLIADKLRRETAEKVYSKDLMDNLLKLNEIQQLPRNWNGNGAQKFSKKIINKAKSLLIDLTLQPQVFPTANNSIQIEFDRDNGAYLEFQLTKSSQLSYFWVKKDGSEVNGTVPCSSYYVNQLLESF